MDSLLTKQNIHVTSDQDMVLLNVGNLTVHIPYLESFKIAQGIRLASKDAMRYIHEDAKKWSDFAKLNDMPDKTTPYTLSVEKRVTVKKDFNWRIGWEGEDIKMLFGNNSLKLHFTMALKISEWLRNAGREAKAWAGHRGSLLNLRGILSNAEENYKLGIH